MSRGPSVWPVVVFVMTTNYAPDGLWPDGIQRERFLPTIALIKEWLDVIEVDAGIDYRLRALQHPPSKPILPASMSYRLAERFEVTSGPFEGLHGEVALTRKSKSGSARARVFVDERMFDTIDLPGIALPIEMALAWPGKIRARLGYDGVEVDDTFQRAVLYALRVAAIAIGEKLGLEENDDRYAASTPRNIRPS